MIYKLVCLVCKYILYFEGSIPISRIDCPLCHARYLPKEIAKITVLVDKS